MDALTRKTNACKADGEVVWFWRLDAGVKLADHPLAMVTNSPITRKSTKETVKTIAQGRPDVSANL